MSIPPYISLISYRCLCGNILRGTQERNQHRCMECNLQEHTNAITLDKLLTFASQESCLQPIAHMIRNALIAEREALNRFFQEYSGIDWLPLYEQREAESSLAHTRMLWISIASQVWHTLEVNGSAPKPYLQALHVWSVEQISRILPIHLAMQIHIQESCSQQQIWIPFGMRNVLHSSCSTLNQPSEPSNPILETYT